MAKSPPHRFGQVVGNLLEEILKPELLKFCKSAAYTSIDTGRVSTFEKGKKSPGKISTATHTTWISLSKKVGLKIPEVDPLLSSKPLGGGIPSTHAPRLRRYKAPFCQSPKSMSWRHRFSVPS